jgi:hypothetical protein
MSTARKSIGYLGATMCLSAFLVTAAAVAWTCAVYIDQRGALCGTGVGMLQIYSCFCAFVLCPVGIGGCRLASEAGFSSRYWRFFRNVTMGLWAFTVLALFIRP